MALVAEDVRHDRRWQRARRAGRGARPSRLPRHGADDGRGRPAARAGRRDAGARRLPDAVDRARSGRRAEVRARRRSLQLAGMSEPATSAAREQLLAGARRLADVAASLAPEIERDRALPPALVTELIERGLTNLCLPSSL